MPKEVSDRDSAECPCCGQERPCPTRAGLWEYSDGHGTGRYWIRASIVDISHLGMDGPLLVVPDGSVHAAWWPSNCAWRKVGDEPTIGWESVVYRGRRLGDGQFVPDEDDRDV